MSRCGLWACCGLWRWLGRSGAPEALVAPGPAEKAEPGRGCWDGGEPSDEPGNEPADAPGKVLTTGALGGVGGAGAGLPGLRLRCAGKARGGLPLLLRRGVAQGVDDLAHGLPGPAGFGGQGRGNRQGNRQGRGQD